MARLNYLFAICALAWSAGAANASTVIFDVTGQFNNPQVTMYHPPENLTGTLTVDDTAGVVTATNLFIPGFSGFTNILHSYEFFAGTWTMTVLNSAGDVLDFLFVPTPVPSGSQLVGLTSGVITGGELYVGCSPLGGLCHDWPNFPAGNLEEYFGGNSLRGNLTLSSAIPEAATWAMMILGFAGIGWAARRARNGLAPSAS